MSKPDYTKVTEIAGEEVSREQVDRLCNRYYWAAPYCRDADVLEVACGTGPGLGYLGQTAKSVVAGDIDENILNTARNHYGDRFEIGLIDALNMDYPDASKDVIIIFEALYYLSDASQFVKDCKRVLRPGGVVLVSNANKDLYDFNPSPFSHEYHGTVELAELFDGHDFEVELFGSTPVDKVGMIQRILRPVKKTVVRFDLMPKTMAGKRLLKRLIFGKPVPMPAEIDASTSTYVEPTPLSNTAADTHHKVLYCAARKR